MNRYKLDQTVRRSFPFNVGDRIRFSDSYMESQNRDLKDLRGKIISMEPQQDFNAYIRIGWDDGLETSELTLRLVHE